MDFSKRNHKLTTVSGERTDAGCLRLGRSLPYDAFGGNGELMLRADSIVEGRKQLSRLRGQAAYFGGYPAQRIMEPDIEGIQLEIAPKISGLDQAIALKKQAIARVETVFHKLETEGDLDTIPVESVVACMVDSLATDPRALGSLVQIKDPSAYTTTHCVNVAILSMYIAMMCGMEREVERIGAGAMLHDVGEMFTPKCILNKHGKLNPDEFSRVQEHPIKGLKLLLESGMRDPVVLSCVIDHHEKLMGGGYPAGKTGSHIGIFAKIVAFADIFDALTTDRPYRMRMTPQQALGVIKQMGVDGYLLHSFTSVVTTMLNNTPQQANTGQTPVSSARAYGLDLPPAPTFRAQS